MPTPVVSLDPELRADAAIARVLLAHRHVMAEHEAGVLKGTDPEDLHDFRVAIRSSRSILNQTRGAFPMRPTLRVRSNLAWLAAATGAARDLDVFLGKLPGYRDRLPGPLAEALGALCDFLEARSGMAYAGLVQTLGTTRYQAFKEFYDRFLRTRAQAEGRPRVGSGPVVALAARALRKRYRRLRREGRWLEAPAAPAEALHELRKTGKKLRYLIEAFRPLCADHEGRAALKGLKTLQDLLGEVVDLAVQRRLLRQWARAIGGRGAGSLDTLAAMQALDVLLEESELEARSALRGHLDLCTGAELRMRMKHLFGGGVA